MTQDDPASEIPKGCVMRAHLAALPPERRLRRRSAETVSGCARVMKRPKVAATQQQKNCPEVSLEIERTGFPGRAPGGGGERPPAGSLRLRWLLPPQQGRLAHQLTADDKTRHPVWFFLENRALAVRFRPSPPNFDDYASRSYAGRNGSSLFSAAWRMALRSPPVG
jgi:hypothetical protein